MYLPLYSPSSSLHTARRTVFLYVTHTLVTESRLFSHSALFTHCIILSDDSVLCAQSCIHRLYPVLALFLHSVPICHTSFYPVSSSCLTLCSHNSYSISLLSIPYPIPILHVSLNTVFSLYSILRSFCSPLHFPSFLCTLSPWSMCRLYTILHMSCCNSRGITWFLSYVLFPYGP